jgi:anti-sigma regulatory factor (Ser/Thr protein kinase)
MHEVLSAIEVRSARASVRDLCHEHNVSGARCDDAQLAVSELLGNALRHGQPPVELEVTWADEGVMVSVADGQPLLSRGGLAASTAESGRGLQMVQAVARSWGCDATPGGKRVWALL